MGKFAIIFDFDGVIALSEHVHARAWEDLATQENRPLPPGFIASGVGSSDPELAVVLAEFWGHELSEARILAAKRDLYQQRVAKECHLVPGVKEALAHAATLAPVALATSSCRRDIAPLLHAYDLEQYFQVVMTIDDVTYAKPHPEIYLKTAAKLGVAPADCWVFEDSIYGTQAARAAGMNVIAITTTFTQEALGTVMGAFPNFLAWTSMHALITEQR